MVRLQDRAALNSPNVVDYWAIQLPFDRERGTHESHYLVDRLNVVHSDFCQPGKR